MKKIIGLICLLSLLFAGVRSQSSEPLPAVVKGKYAKVNFGTDTIKERDRASETLRELKNGAVIVRLKRNLKSIDAYKKAGQYDIAEKIEADRVKQNEKIFWAFTENFLFCDVYFIYADDTKAFLDGNSKLFLNEKMEYDPKIVLKDTNFIFCEFGTVEAFSKFSDYSNPEPARSVDIKSGDNNSGTSNTVPAKTSTSPATTSGLFFSDKNLHPLMRPFPFVEGVYLENYNGPVRALNHAMERAYGRLVVKRDFKEKIKAERKKKIKKERYNPFK